VEIQEEELEEEEVEARDTFVSSQLGRYRTIICLNLIHLVTEPDLASGLLTKASINI
jgi:hypothetical protein